MHGIVKDFPGVRALDGVDLDVRAGEVHCLLGQNGAGKSTLIKVLAGAHRPDGGTVHWQGEEVDFTSPSAALKHGIATIYQELDLVPGLTVSDNIHLGRWESSAGFVRRGAQHAATRDLLRRLGHPEIPAQREVGRLSAAQQQIVSLARALAQDARLIVMDEPSAVLAHDEVDNLFRVIRDLTAAGVAVVYISHRLEEIRTIGDVVTVLKDGRTVATRLPARDTPTREVVALMTGRTVEYLFPPRPDGERDLGAELLVVENLALTGAFENVSFAVHAGEIVGIAGLVGAGRTEVLETVYGARHRTSGTVTMEGHALPPGRVPAAVRRGLGLAPEERKSQALLLGDSVARNVGLASLPRLSRFGWLDRAAERREADETTRSLDVRPAGVDRAARTLSGGNQQKVVLARWLLGSTRLLLLDEPTRGVDVGARSEIYALIRRLADSGMGVLLVSSEVPEVLGLADRVLVMREGRVVHDGPATGLDEHRVLDLVMEGSNI
ncbi:sugar ABC transporter ATP-binding protein [Spongisporangium articulatum]|uniref:Sugar ABC transporter ATP-binding protein n=1 Tax=Spongisporangium articulatum TaxID=3362603 RepID=A0ABW8AKX4_9ACTN